MTGQTQGRGVLRFAYHERKRAWEDEQTSIVRSIDAEASSRYENAAESGGPGRIG